MSVHSIVSGSLLEKRDGKQREDFARETYVLFMYCFFFLFLKLDVRTTCRIRHDFITISGFHPHFARLKNLDGPTAFQWFRIIFFKYLNIVNGLDFIMEELLGRVDRRSLY